MSGSHGAPRVGILGGSGLYELAGLDAAEERRVDTPYGPPSDTLRVGTLAGERVAFLARHGRAHTLLPSEIDYRANLWALKDAGVERVLSASAVGSLRDAIRPRDVVLPDQLIDRTRGRRGTFFGDGVVAHVSLADPFCAELARALADEAEAAGARVHRGGTYLCIEGPAFSTRAESRLYRSWQADVIGMTNATEARLAREAELCYATLALVTDWDCWREEGEEVTVTALLDNLRANAELAARTVRAVVARLCAAPRRCACAVALDHAILTPLDAIPKAARQRLAPLLARQLGA